MEEDSTGTRFSYLVSELDALYHQASMRFGLSDSAMGILYTLNLLGSGSPLSEIIRLTGIQKQTINSSLRNLEKEGILYLEAAQGRKKNVFLTEKGEKLARSTAGVVMRAEEDTLSSWTKEEQAMYLALTERFLLQMGKKIGGL